MNVEEFFKSLEGLSMDQIKEKMREDSIRLRGGNPASPDDLSDNKTQCPSCFKVYKRAISKDDFESGKYQGKIESEQWQTGICSDECWNKFLGME